MDYLDKAYDAFLDGDEKRLHSYALLTIMFDTREMLEIARKNQRYIEQTMKEMGNDRGSET